ncbi:oxygenase MpaB family protein [Methyloglobulus sp.]|uniref:oxygenase MpaB family protein n=1 Tax=Methyloglobulus sp. TaxID=2518622 RepID=UPI003989E75B
MKREITDSLAALDPEKDYEEIMYLLQCYEFPWDYERALEFALFRTYAVPSISALLYKTGEFVSRPRKRYDDTELILYEITENGFDSERGRAALRRMNQMHGRFPIANEDFLYVLSTFVFEPIRWIEHFGWRLLRENEKLGIFQFYSELGRRMNIKDIPKDINSFEDYNIEYGRTHFRYAEVNYHIGSATRDLLLGFYLPKILWPLGKPFINAMMDDPLCEAFGFYKVPVPFQRFVKNSLKLRGKPLRFFPERRQPRLGTQVKRPTYPGGYKIEELGTFKKPDSVLKGTMEND